GKAEGIRNGRFALCMRHACRFAGCIGRKSVLPVDIGKSHSFAVQQIPNFFGLFVAQSRHLSFLAPTGPARPVCFGCSFSGTGKTLTSIYRQSTEKNRSTLFVGDKFR